MRGAKPRGRSVTTRRRSTASPWHAGNSGRQYQQVARLEANAWGLFDLHGNVAEWTLDAYAGYAALGEGDILADPIAWPSTEFPRSVRGGFLEGRTAALRCAARRGSAFSWKRMDPQDSTERLVPHECPLPRLPSRTAAARTFLGRTAQALEAGPGLRAQDRRPPKTRRARLTTRAPRQRPAASDVSPARRVRSTRRRTARSPHDSLRSH